MPAKTAADLKNFNDKNPDEKTFVKITNTGSNLVVYFCDESGRETESGSSRPYGKIQASNVDASDGECRNAFKVRLTSDTLSGWGPMLYDCLITSAGQRGITPDRMSITPDAVRVWKIYYNQRQSDVNSLPLDITGTLTPNDKSDDCISDHETLGSFENPDLRNKDTLDVVNRVYYDNGIPTVPDLEKLNLVYKKSMQSQLMELYNEFLMEVGYNKKLLKKMGYDYVGRNKRIASDTFIHSKDDNNPSYHKKLTKRINKNLSKGGYYRSKKHDTLKDPPAMGISWTKGEKG